MHGVLRWFSLAVLTVGLALWFFGGMNLGRTRTVARPATPDTPAGAATSGGDFRPGADFLAACGLVAAGLWLAARPRGVKPGGAR